MNHVYERLISDLRSRDDGPLTSDSALPPENKYTYIPLNCKTQRAKQPNRSKTQKYNWFTFLPLSVLEQFKLFSNQYFLFISLT